MAFPTYPYQGYQPAPYYPGPVPDQLAQLRQGQMQPMQQAMQPQMVPQPQPASNGILWVQGEEGAKAYMVAAGSSVMLMDSDANVFYIKSADESGVPRPLRIFDYAERTAAQRTPTQPTQQPSVEYVPRAEFDALAARVAELTAQPTKETDNG